MARARRTADLLTSSLATPPAIQHAASSAPSAFPATPAGILSLATHTNTVALRSLTTWTSARTNAASTQENLPGRRWSTVKTYRKCKKLGSVTVPSLVGVNGTGRQRCFFWSRGAVGLWGLRHLLRCTLPRRWRRTSPCRAQWVAARDIFRP